MTDPCPQCGMAFCTARDSVWCKRRQDARDNHHENGNVPILVSESPLPPHIQSGVDLIKAQGSCGNLTADLKFCCIKEANHSGRCREPEKECDENWGVLHECCHDALRYGEAIDRAYQEALCGPAVGNMKTPEKRLRAIVKILAPYQTEIG